MTLSPEDRKQLLQALQDAFPEHADLNEMVFNHLPVSLEAVSESRKLPQVMIGLIQWAENNDKVPLLLAGARAQNQDNDLLEAVADAITARLAASAPVYRSLNPYHVCLPRQDLPFVNRGELRRTLEAMVCGAGTAVLAVEGEPRMGKTHTSHLISYLGNNVRDPQNNPVYRTVSVHLADEGPDFEASDLAREVVYQLGRPEREATLPPRQDTEQEARWVRRLASWCVGEVREAVKYHQIQQIWLVVDGFQQTPAAQSTRDLLRRLAQMAHYNVPELRLILLDHPAAIPEIERFIQRDRIGWPEKMDVVDFYQKVVAGTGRTMGAPLLRKLADATWVEAEPRDPGFMERLEGAIRRRLPKLLGRA